jgi:hypothetical protein
MKRGIFIFLFALFFLALTFSHTPTKAQEVQYLKVDKLTQGECGVGFTDNPLTLLSNGNPTQWHHCTKYSAYQPGEPYITNSYIKVGELCEDRDQDGSEDISTSANALNLNDQETGIFLCYTTSQTSQTSDLITSSTLTSGICPPNSDEEELQITFKDAEGNTLRHCVSQTKTSDLRKRTRTEYCENCGSCVQGEHPRCGEDIPQSELVTPYSNYLYNCKNTADGYSWIRGVASPLCGTSTPPSPGVPPPPRDCDKQCVLGDLKWGKDLTGAFIGDHCYYCSIDYDDPECNDWSDQGDQDDRQGICGGIKFNLPDQQRPPGCFGQQQIEEPEPTVQKPEEPVEVYLGGHDYKANHRITDANWIRRKSDLWVLSNTEKCGQIRADLKPELHGNADFVKGAAQSAEKTVQGYLPQFKITDFLSREIVFSGDNDLYERFNIDVFMKVLGNTVDVEVSFSYSKCLNEGWLSCKKWSSLITGNNKKTYTLTDEKIPIFIREATTPPSLGAKAIAVGITELPVKKNFDPALYKNIIQNCK